MHRVPSRLRQAVAPLYLLLCLLLGGSAQGILANLVLQLVGIGLVAWSALAEPDNRMPKPARQLLWLALAGLFLVAIQLIPVPIDVWSTLR